MIFEVGFRSCVTVTVKRRELVNAMPLETATDRVVSFMLDKTFWMLAALPAPLTGPFAGTVIVYVALTEPPFWSSLGNPDFNRRIAIIDTSTQLAAGTAANFAMPFSTPFVTLGSLTNVSG